VFVINTYTLSTVARFEAVIPVFAWHDILLVFSFSLFVWCLLQLLFVIIFEAVVQVGISSLAELLYPILKYARRLAHPVAELFCSKSSRNFNSELHRWSFLEVTLAGIFGAKL
jgi:hypothetical protein